MVSIVVQRGSGTNIVILVDCPHSSLALSLSDDLASVFDNDLVRLERAVAADTIPPVRRLDDLDTNVVLAASFSPLFELVEVAVAALSSYSAVTVVAFVEHETILTIVITACLLCAQAFRQFQALVCPPYTSSFSDKDVY